VKSYNNSSVRKGYKLIPLKRKNHVIICPIFYKEIYELRLQLIVNLLQRNPLETILLNVSAGCALTNELENLIINYYRFLRINQINENCNYIFKRTSKPMSLFSNEGN